MSRLYNSVSVLYFEYERYLSFRDANTIITALENQLNFHIQFTYAGADSIITANGKSAIGHAFRLDAEWNNPEADMLCFSSIYPDYIFILEFESVELGGDRLQRNYYYNGKVQKAPARIVFDNFDLEKLE